MNGSHEKTKLRESCSVRTTYDLLSNMQKRNRQRTLAMYCRYALSVNLYFRYLWQTIN